MEDQFKWWADFYSKKVAHLRAKVAAMTPCQKREFEFWSKELALAEANLKIWEKYL